MALQQSAGRVASVLRQSVGSGGGGGGGGGGSPVDVAASSRVFGLVDAVEDVADEVSKKSVSGLIKQVDVLRKHGRRRRRRQASRRPACRKGYGGNCYSKSMLMLLDRVRRQLLVIKQNKRDMAYVRKLRGRRFGAKTLKSLAKTYGKAEARKIAQGKMTMPQGGKLRKIPIRKVRGRTQYRYEIAFPA
jgi:hypothetical protein